MLDFVITPVQHTTPAAPPSARYLVIDLGFAIEPREDETLPEAVLGAVRLSRMDVSRGPLLSPVVGEGVLGSDKHFTEEELRQTE